MEWMGNGCEMEWIGKAKEWLTEIRNAYYAWRKGWGLYQCIWNGKGMAHSDTHGAKDGDAVSDVTAVVTMFGLKSRLA